VAMLPPHDGAFPTQFTPLRHTCSAFLRTNHDYTRPSTAPSTSDEPWRLGGVCRNCVGRSPHLDNSATPHRLLARTIGQPIDIRTVRATQASKGLTDLNNRLTSRI
jgi:hypothetical protein